MKYISVTSMCNFLVVMVLCSIISITHAAVLSIPVHHHNWVDSQNQPIRDSSGRCLRDGTWTPSNAHPHCDGFLQTVEPVAKNQETAKVDHIKKPLEDGIKVPDRVRPCCIFGPFKQRLETTILFEFDSSRVDKKNEETIKNLISTIRRDFLEIEVVNLYGYTDNLGTKKYNYDLSLRRADAVKRIFLIYGFEMQKIVLHAGVDDHAKASNSNAMEKAKHRRVLIQVNGTANRSIN